MTIVNRHNVEVLIEIVARHPVEIGKEHTVSVVHVVEVGVIHRIDEIAEGVLFNDGINPSRVVHHVELDVVLLRREPSGKRHEKQHQGYVSCEFRLSHDLPFDFLAVVTLPCGVFLDVIGGALRGGGRSKADMAWVRKG